MTHYNLNPWPDDSAEEEWVVECAPGQVFTFHGDELHAPGRGTTEDRVALALRSVCHFLVDQIENRGLEEVCRSLAEFYAYYRPAEHTSQRLTVRTGHAVGCTRSISPAFEIEED